MSKLSPFLVITIFVIASLTVLVSAANTSSNQPWNKRPRQFRMQIYSRPDHKGEVQTIRTSNGASTPCWNLSSKRVGSFELNDPLVKVTFYRSADCKGASSSVFNQGSLSQNHVMIKAKSVTITKVKPLSLKDQHSL